MEVLELLLAGPRSPTKVAEELGVSVQTASRNLKSLVDRGFAERTRDRNDGGEGRGYKRFRACEFARVFAGFDGGLFDETLELTPAKRAVLSVWQVPQPEFHPVLLSYLFSEPLPEREGFEVTAIAVYGSVARGTATPGSDVDLLLLTGDGVDTDEIPGKARPWTGGQVAEDAERLVVETWLTVGEFRDGLDAGSRFLGSVLDEGIVLYDPEGVVRNARQERASESVPA